MFPITPGVIRNIDIKIVSGNDGPFLTFRNAAAKCAGLAKLRFNPGCIFLFEQAHELTNAFLFHSFSSFSSTSRLFSKMSRQMIGSHEAMRVISRNPPAASTFIKLILLVEIRNLIDQGSSDNMRQMADRSHDIIMFDSIHTDNVGLRQFQQLLPGGRPLPGGVDASGVST